MMPTVTAVPPQKAVAQARSDRRVSRLLRDLHGSCDTVLDSRRTASRVGEEREALAERHPEFAGADLRAIAVFWIMVFLPLAVWLVDVCLLSAVAEYLATLMFPDRPQVVLAARLFVALAVVGVELGLATRLHHAHEIAEETENRLPYLTCWVAAIVWAAFLAACLVATQQAAGAEGETSTLTLMYALAGFCFLLHLLLPFSHELLYEAKGYLLFHMRDSKLRTTERRAGHAEERARRASTVIFQDYARDLNRHNGIHAQMPLLAGPFSVAVRTVVNEIFGEGTIPAPNRIAEANPSPSAAPPTRPVAPTTGNGGSTGQNPPPGTDTPDAPNAENEYLRTVLSRRQQDEESEVKP